MFARPEPVPSIVSLRSISRLAPEQLTRWAAVLVLLLALGTATGGWEFRRSLLRERERALHAATVASSVLLSVFNVRVTNRAAASIGAAIELVRDDALSDLSEAANRMRARSDGLQKACAGVASIERSSCDVLMAEQFLLLRAGDTSDVGVSGSRSGRVLSKGDMDRVRRLAYGIKDDVLLRVLPLGAGDSTNIAFLRSWRDPDNLRVFAVAQAPADSLAATLFEPARRSALDGTFPGEPASDSFASFSIHLRSGERIFQTVPQYRSTIVVRAPLALTPDSVAMIELTVNPDYMHMFVPGGIPEPPDRTLGVAAVLLLVLVIGALLVLGEARRLMTTRTLFLTGVSHELRTPLTQILMYGELLERGEVREDRQKKAQTIIVRESRRLIHMIENILAFARSGTGRLPLNARPLVLAEVISNTLDDLGPLIIRHGAVVERDLDSSCTVLADAGAIRQILVNLIDNALRFGPASQVVRVSLVRAHKKALLTVSDQGPGIAPALRALAWEPFIRLNDGQGGTGIGLPLVRLLAEAMNGSAAFGQPEAGAIGLRVEVLLPLAHPVTGPSGEDAAPTGEP